MEYWTAGYVQQLTDNTLIRSILAFRHALSLLQGGGARRDGGPYVDDMKRGIAAMEAECLQRDIYLPGRPGAAHRAAVPRARTALPAPTLMRQEA